MTNNILVTGGSGFIGNQVVHELHEWWYDNVTVVDREVKHWDAPANIFEADFLEFLDTYNMHFDTVIHFAAEHQVGLSVTNPDLYYENNVVKMKGLLDHMVKRGIKNIIFSSSGGVYGNHGANGPLTETACYHSANSYASTKITGELLIQDYAKAYGINYVNFRYFNAAGADPYGNFGYIQRPATHVIPILCNKILNGETFKIFGNDYNTKDGTCVRDYVHVHDLAHAHIKALEFLEDGGKNETFNIGGGVGTSVKELVEYAGKVVGKQAVVEYAPRREGDPDMLVADISKAQRLLYWQPQYNIKDMITHAWDWERKLASAKVQDEKRIQETV